MSFTIFDLRQQPAFFDAVADRISSMVEGSELSGGLHRRTPARKYGLRRRSVGAGGAHGDKLYQALRR